MAPRSFLLWLRCAMCVLCLASGSRAIAQTRQSEATASGPNKTETAVRGTWSGTFYSKHSNMLPFTMTVEITPDAKGHLVGTSSLSSNCIRGAKLHVTVSGTTVVLAGSDEEGDNITVRGTVDSSGSLLKSTYIVNGSATGRCETDDGTGELAKR